MLILDQRGSGLLMLGGIYKRFRSLPTIAQIVLALLALGLAVALSPLSLFLAATTFVVSVAVLLYRLLTRRPLGPWIPVAVCSFLLIFVFVPTTDALYGTSEQEPEEEEASTPTNTEETPEEEPPAEETPPPRGTDTTDAVVDEVLQEKPKPTDPDERIRFNLEEALPDGQDVRAAVRTDANGCRDVQANYQTNFMGTLEELLGVAETTLRSEMETLYKAVYGDGLTRQYVCRLTVNAYGTLYDDYGQASLELFYTTHMDRATADRINWQDTASVNFPKLWTVDYVHPEVEEKVAQQDAEQALDCLQRGGLFDFDWLQCP